MNIGKGEFLFRNRLLWHVLFWVFVYLFYTLSYGTYQNNFKGEIIENLLLMPIRMLGVYSLIYYLLPKFLLKKRYGVFIILSIVHAILYSSIIWIIIYSFNFASDKSVPLLSLGDLLTTLIDNYKIPVVAVAIKLFKTLYVEQVQKQQLINEQQKAELSLLKTQIHPHFLFNTLNNLYSLTLVKSDNAPNVVVKLSQLLTYTLYDCNGDLVDLQKEMEFIENYISLQKIRHNSALVSIDLNIDNPYTDKQVAPLLLLPIVENCFKHGVDKSEGNSHINVYAKCYDNHLDFYAENSILENQSQSKTIDGLGVTNIKRRLELLYKDKYELDIVKENLTFKVRLKLFWK